MSVLRSIEELSQRTPDAEYPVSVAVKGLRLGRRTCRRARARANAEGK